MPSSIDFQWEEPTAQTKGRFVKGRDSVWQKRLRPCMIRPGDWARVHVANDANQASTMAWMLRVGKLRKPEGEWEFTSRGKFVYARFLGADETITEEETLENPVFPS